MKPLAEVVTLYPKAPTETRIAWPLLVKTFIALLFFAGNSILCRWAIKDEIIDPSSFSAIRLLSAAVTLVILYLLRFKQWKPLVTDNSIEQWLGAGLLFLYAVCFSFAYLKLDAGLGALILFSCVQLTMLVYTFSHEGGLNSRQWVGLIIAMAGLGYLLSPSAMRPDIQGVLLMATAGVAWAGYTLLGKRAKVSATLLTTKQFLLTLCLVVPFFILNLPMMMLSPSGVGLAIVSGAVTSGVGYLVWNSVLPQLQALTAGVIQLTVPVMAMLLGAIMLTEWPSLHNLLASIVIIIGVGCIVCANVSLGKRAQRSA
ncbi:DMT family transporter [Thaumasiovibrio subtropicus]|uniref:DMT family transporter n=1 Tax=Thaumasiovibrio subtropicus TaxID=1891207 RepID=UPI000B3601B4|nr:EamA family transporter [Thaumasiovibrio subtropicus]